MIDIVVMCHLFHRFPEATSGHLSAVRSRAVCGPTLASIAVRHLELHKHLLINNIELSTAITRYVPLLESLLPEDVIVKGYKHDPPKALSDVLESLIGAVLVDSTYDFERTAANERYVGLIFLVIPCQRSWYGLPQQGANALVSSECRVSHCVDCSF